MFKEEDGDSYTQLSMHFNINCNRLVSNKLSDESYILSISGLQSNDSNVIIGRSDRIAQVYNVSNNNIVLSNHLETDSEVIGVKACPENENIFYVGTSNCNIQIWDIRQSDVATVFKDTTVNGNTTKTLSCFDVSSNNLLISGGTDLFASDAYILFWDVRKCDLMGAYWESHSDDVTQVLFKPNDMNKLVSGSTDGLINVYDLTQSCEDDALVDSLNTMSSIEKLVWYKEKDVDGICCITHTDDIKLWKLDQAGDHNVSRENLAHALTRKLEYVYIAGAYVNPKNGQLNILSGSSYEPSPCLCGFSYVKNKLVPTCYFEENKQTVRCFWYNYNADILLTGGENGTLDLWNIKNVNHFNGILDNYSSL